MSDRVRLLAQGIASEQLLGDDLGGGRVAGLEPLLRDAGEGILVAVGQALPLGRRSSRGRGPRARSP